MGIYLFKEAWETPNCSVLYIAKTIDSAERIMWRPILKEIDQQLGLGCHFNNAKRIVTLPNGSQIYILGADANEDEQQKLLGQKFKLAVIDEASKFRLDVKRIIFDKLKPAVADYMGTIAMIGTPDDFINSYFAEVTRGNVPGWEVHTWSALDNPHMAENFQSEMDELLKTNPNTIEEAWFRQNYLKEWVVRDEVKMYKHTEDNIISTLPGHPMEAIMGISFNNRGYMGIAVVGYSEKSRSAYIIDEFKSENIDVKYVVSKIEEYSKRYNIIGYTCPGASKKLLENVRLRYGLSLGDVSEKDQATLIRLFNSELSSKNIKVFQKCTDIVYEWDSIVVDEDNMKDLREHPNCHSPVATAATYAWYMCYNYSYQPKQVTDDPMDEYWTELEERLEYGDSYDYEF